MLRKVILGLVIILFLVLVPVIIIRYINAQELKIPPGHAISLEEFGIEEEILKENGNYIRLYRITKKHYEAKTMIGNSKVDLEPFVGKKVKIEYDFSRRPNKGGFPRLIMAKEQCIRNKCHPISKENPELESEVIDINSITVVNLKASPTAI